mmetsp:Transcript_35144/g.76196  ORF Transcript_35144/g.76196 Transcript_35144/m.76196 type:complete len:117 (-) Transcript_35144:381-731(-)
MRDDDDATIGRKFFTVDNILCCCCCVIRFGLASAVIDRAFADGEVIKQLQQQVRSRVLAVMVPMPSLESIWSFSRSKVGIVQYLQSICTCTTVAAICSSSLARVCRCGHCVDLFFD